jgi:hypothetical protein
MRIRSCNVRVEIETQWIGERRWRGDLLVQSVEEESGVVLEFRRDSGGRVVRSIKSSVWCRCIESLRICEARAWPRHRHLHTIIYQLITLSCVFLTLSLVWFERYEIICVREIVKWKEIFGFCRGSAYMVWWCLLSRICCYLKIIFFIYFKNYF